MSGLGRDIHQGGTTVNVIEQYLRSYRPDARPDAEIQKAIQRRNQDCKGNLFVLGHVVSYQTGLQRISLCLRLEVLLEKIV